jgi:L-malate glycosyltransferase
VQTQLRKVVFLWENFGPMHIDRCAALALELEGSWEVVGIQWTRKSSTYEWVVPEAQQFKLVTLFPDFAPRALSSIRKIRKTLAFCLESKADAFFFSHYNDPAIIITSAILALLRKRVFCMILSKFDDYDRRVGFEFLKALALLPYAGFLTNRGRSADYVKFLRGKKARIAYGYNTLSVREIRTLANAPLAPAGTPHSERHFTAITRLVPKKNLDVLLDAYALYRDGVDAPRPLHICGSGELEAHLRARIVELRLEGLVVLRGFLQRPEVARELAGTLALVLPSTEEQFGNVVIEAHAMGVPTIISYNCGVRETLVRNGVNGFLVEPDNPEGLALYMRWLDADEGLWRRLAEGCGQLLPRCDTPAFAAGVRELL